MSGDDTSEFLNAGCCGNLRDGDTVSWSSSELFGFERDVAMSPVVSHSHAACSHEAVKARGRENAALQHERNAAKHEVPRAQPAAIVQLSPTAAARSASSASGTLVVGNDSHVQINSRDGSGSGTIVVGDRSDLHINSRGTAGSGTLIVGDDSKVHLNGRDGAGSGTILVGDRSDVHINGGGSVQGTLVVGNGASVHVEGCKPGSFSIEAGSQMYVGDFDSRRLAGSVEAPADRARSAKASKTAHPHGHQVRKERMRERDLPEEDTSSSKTAELTDPRLQVMRALLEHVDRERSVKAEKAKDGRRSIHPTSSALGTTTHPPD